MISTLYLKFYTYDYSLSVIHYNFYLLFIIPIVIEKFQVLVYLFIYLEIIFKDYLIYNLPHEDEYRLRLRAIYMQKFPKK